MSKNILDTVLNEIRLSPFFALQLDESTDNASCSQDKVATQDKIVSYLHKMKLYQCRAKVEDIPIFPELTMVLMERNK